jgi:hypothetical protein
MEREIRISHATHNLTLEVLDAARGCDPVDAIGDVELALRVLRRRNAEITAYYAKQFDEHDSHLHGQG